MSKSNIFGEHESNRVFPEEQKLRSAFFFLNITNELLCRVNVTILFFVTRISVDIFRGKIVRLPKLFLNATVRKRVCRIYTFFSPDFSTGPEAGFIAFHSFVTTIERCFLCLFLTNIPRIRA